MPPFKLQCGGFRAIHQDFGAFVGMEIERKPVIQTENPI
jgi:hypothetical protein